MRLSKSAQPESEDDVAEVLLIGRRTYDLFLLSEYEKLPGALPLPRIGYALVGSGSRQGLYMLYDHHMALYILRG